MKSVGIILVNYQDYAEKYLVACLSSIFAQDYSGHFELVIVDNQSSDKTYQYLKKAAPTAHLIRNQNNDGFAKGNNDAIHYFLNKQFDYVFLLNLDATLAPNALTELVNLASSQPQAAAIQARLMLGQSPEKINSLGNVTHFLGFGYCSAYQEKYKFYNKLSDLIAYPSGAAVLLRVEALRQVGLFDEEFWMYNEDQDLGWRFWLAGLECQVAYQAVAFHYYEFSRSIKKNYYLDRNRILAAFKNYSIASLIIFAPTFFLMELGLLFFAWRSGWLTEKLRVYGYFLRPSTWRYLIQARRTSQKLRQRPDSQIIRYFSGKISHQEIDNPLLKRVVNPIFNIYFLISRFILRILGF